MVTTHHCSPGVMMFCSAAWAAGYYFSISQMSQLHHHCCRAVNNNLLLLSVLWKPSLINLNLEESRVIVGSKDSILLCFSLHFCWNCQVFLVVGVNYDSCTVTRPQYLSSTPVWEAVVYTRTLVLHWHCSVAMCQLVLDQWYSPGLIPIWALLALF